MRLTSSNATSSSTHMHTRHGPQRPRTTLFLHATGGVRLLPIKQQELFIEIARNMFSGTSFSFTPAHVSVLSGTIEVRLRG